MPGRAARVGGAARERGRGVPRARPARSPARRGDRSDFRPRPPERLPAGGLDAGARGGGEGAGAGVGGLGGPGIDGGAGAGDARLPRPGGAHARLRQQHPPGRARGGRRRRLRLSRLRARLHPPALLRRQGPLPVGGALRRSRGHLPHGREGEGAAPRRRPPPQLARHGARAHPLPGAALPDMLARPRRARPRRPRVQRDGGERRAARPHRDRPRPPRLRLGRESQPGDRRDAGRERRGIGLALAQRAAQLRERRDLGQPAPRRRGRHRLLPARGHGGGVRRQRRGGAAPRAGAHQRSRERRDAPRRRGLRAPPRGHRLRAGATRLDSCCRSARRAVLSLDST